MDFHFSGKIRPLKQSTSFPLFPLVLISFENLKNELEKAVLVTLNPQILLVIETDTSDFAISASLKQEIRSNAFFS